jgi:hypothetical protein
MPGRRLVLLGAIALILVELPAASTRAGGDRASTLPASMTGTWGWSAQSCANAADDGRVVIKARSVAFFASSYRLQSLVVKPDGAYHAAAATNEEGEPSASRGVIALKLLGPALLKIWTDTAGAHTYVRCASDAPAR